MTAIPVLDYVPPQPKPPPKPKWRAWQVRVVVLAGWALFAVMVISISWAGTFVRGGKAVFFSLVTWNLGWMLWAPTTFLVVRLAKQLPIDKANLTARIPMHVLIGVGVSAALVFVEFIISVIISLGLSSVRFENVFHGYFVYKFHIYFLIYWMILGATWAYDYHARYRASELQAAELQGQLAQAQLGALQMQLQPHFLFNAHHSIISLMLKNETAAAVNMLTRLSDLLRLTLRNGDRQVTSLKEELDALDLYLGIQRERYRERLTVRIDVAPELLTAEVPMLLLQPLVENALKHGIDTISEGGTLDIRAWREEMRLHLRVADNGPGLPPDFDIANGDGIGLRNTRERLERLYGEKQRFEIVSRGGADRDGEGQPGTEVHIELPLKQFDPAAAAAAGTGESPKEGRPA